MEFTKKDMKMLQGVAILFMLALHLFARKEINGLYETFPEINGVPLVYYLALFGDACVPVYLFVSGYGLYVSLGNGDRSTNNKKNMYRILKLLSNFWIILFVFMLIAYIFGRFNEVFPGGFTSFLLNFSLLSNSYNGAWWYVQTYVLLILLTPFMIKIVQKNSSLFIFLGSGIIYFLSYLQRIRHVIDIGDNSVLVILVNAAVLLGTSQFAFIVGMIFAKEHIYTKIKKRLNNISYKNVLCIFGVMLLIIIHSFIESMIIAPINAIIFICLFSIMQKAKWLQKLLLYMGNHSTNIWLIHMFFYMSIFPKLIFAPKYPVLIFLNLLFFSLVSSYIINLIYSPVLKIIDTYQRSQSNFLHLFTKKPLEK